MIVSAIVFSNKSPSVHPHLHILEPMTKSNLSAVAVSQMSWNSKLWLHRNSCPPVFARCCSSHGPSINAPQTVPSCSSYQHYPESENDPCRCHDLPLRPLLVEYTMSAFLAPDRVAPPQAYFVVAFAADILHLWTRGAFASLDAI